MAAQVQSATQVLHHLPPFGLHTLHGHSYPPSNAQRPHSNQQRYRDFIAARARAAQVALPVSSSYPDSSSAYRGRAAVQHVGPSSEDSLRRKTPNGTLVGAYNGTFAESDVRQHASKQLLLPNMIDPGSAPPRRFAANAKASHRRSSVGMGPKAANAISRQWQTTGTVPYVVQADSILHGGSPFYSPMDWQYTEPQLNQLVPNLQAPVRLTGPPDLIRHNQQWQHGPGILAQTPMLRQGPAAWPAQNTFGHQHKNFSGAVWPNSPYNNQPTNHTYKQIANNGRDHRASLSGVVGFPQPNNNNNIQAPFHNVYGHAAPSPPTLSAVDTFALDYETPEQVLQKGYIVYSDLLTAMQRARSQHNGIHKISKPYFAPFPLAKTPYSDPSRGQNPNGVSSLTNGSVFTRWTSENDLRTAGYNIIHALNKVCSQGNADWIEAMLLCGSVSYVLGEHGNAIQWYSRILELDSSHVEAVSNLAASYLAQNRRREAEQYWRLAIQLRPAYFEAVEQLVQMLCTDQRQKEAVEVIDHVQAVLGPASKNDHQHTHPNLQYSDLLGNRYTSPMHDNGRLMGLIHAKANILYNGNDQLGAARAFEEVVLVAAGYSSGSIDTLINTILAALSCFSMSSQDRQSGNVREHLLLPPDKALQTARLCFPNHGSLPGLTCISDASVHKSAVSLTSNSLLSLAKVFQDGMNPSATHQSGFKSAHGVRNILALYYLSLSLQPSPSTANNVGILLASVQHISKNKGPQESFMFPGVVPGSGVALALTYYKYGLNLDTKHAHLYTNLGSLLKDIGQLPIAVQMYEKAVQCDSSFDIALANLANAVKDQGKVTEAIKYYRKAVEVNPKFSEAVCGLANALNSICEWKGRGGVKLEGGQLDRWHVSPENELRDALRSEENTPGWISCVVDVVENQLNEGRNWGRNILTDPYIEQLAAVIASCGTNDATKIADRTQTLVNMMKSWKGQRWEGARVVWLVERASKWIAWQWYTDKYFRFRKLPESAYSRPRLPEALAVPGAPTVLPFHTFTLPVNAKQVRLISQRNGLRVSTSTLRAPWLPSSVFRPPHPPAPYIKVGYISSDFNNHPLAHLMQSVFGMHDKKRIRAYCYATTASDNSVHRHQIEREAPVFCDASNWSVEKLVRQIVADGIHILINLNGYTRGARNEVFAARAAPIQMAFMGFAGTLGAEWCDYLLADEVAVPPSSLRPGRRSVDPFDLSEADNSTGNDQWVYAENIIYTRSTFFCCDHRQSAVADIAKERSLTWHDEQQRRWKMRKEVFPDLPDDAVILGNFNQLYKIDPTTFRTWLRILSRVKNAYLWLLRFPADGQANLLATAEQWAGSCIASRILFTDVAAKQTHIARGCIADLFLDTPECNAHTTSADCLWSGTPLLTLPRYPWKMCSRMAAGILAGALDRSTLAGRQAYDDLVATSEDDYEARAIRLASELHYAAASDGVGAAGRLVDLRRTIWEGRWTCDLFDTRRWVRDLETAYDVAWRRWVNGEGGDIYLKELCGD